MTKTETKWRVVRIKGAKAEQVCILKAPSSEAAIAAAVKKFDIAEPVRKRLAAHPYE